MTPTDSYAVPASAFEPAAVETPAERAARKAVKAAKKAAKAKAAAVSPATTPELVPGAAKKKRKAAEPAAVEPAAKELKPTRLSNAAYRTTHEIKVADDCPDVYQSFEEAPFPAALQAALRGAFASPTPIQAVAWPLALAGRDLVAVAKTGSGKTCGYLLPGLARLVASGGPTPPPRSEPQAGGWWKTDPVAPSMCVLAPTRELAVQIADEAAKFAAPLKAHVVCVYGGTDKGGQLRAMRGGCDLVVATPGRLNDFLEPPQGRTPPITAKAVVYLVLDEADRMLDMGFEPQIRSIVAACKPGAQRTTLMFTATWPKSVASMASRLTRPGVAHVRIGDNGSKLVVNSSVTQHVEVLPGEAAKMGRLASLLKEKLGKDDRAIVFCGTKRKCEVVTQALRAAGHPVAGAIHGDKTQHEREAALAALRTGARRVLVATDVAARGLDIPGVSIVVVLDFPREVADYVHRVGRTGRAGATGAAYTFLTPADAGIARQLLALIKASQPAAEVPKDLEKMANASRPAGGGGGSGGGGWRGGRSSGGGRGGRGGGGGRGRRW